MTELEQVQKFLKETGRYHGEVDNLWGNLTRSAIITAFTDGPDTPLCEKDFRDSAQRLNVPVAHIKAMAQVEAAGAGFYQGKPKILPEPHIFSRLTNRVFDRKYPKISYRKWGTFAYPRSQDARYDMLLDMIRVSPMAGFASASYGKFQILGSNFKVCGYDSPMKFAFSMARDEGAQLAAFENFLRGNNIVPDLKAGNWANVARKYNGPAYKKNKYDTKLAAAAKSFS